MAVLVENGILLYRVAVDMATLPLTPHYLAHIVVFVGFFSVCNVWKLIKHLGVM